MSNMKLFLLIGTSLSFLPTLSLAQCVATQDCATLGYTETSCNGGKGVKCPFGNKWACLPTEVEICKKNGFTESCTGTGQSGSGKSCGGLYAECSCSSSYPYTCSGTGYAGGAGSACGGKYTQCKCAAEYEWKDGACKQKVLNGAQGDLYYCNGKVVGVKTPEMNFYVAMNDIGKMEWYDASDVNYSFCKNLEGVWPNKERLLTMYNNKSSLNNLLSMNGGKKLTEDRYWSAELYGNLTYIVDMSSGFSHQWRADLDYSYYVRPVLISW